MRGDSEYRNYVISAEMRDLNYHIALSQGLMNPEQHERFNENVIKKYIFNPNPTHDFMPKTFNQRLNNYMLEALDPTKLNSIYPSDSPSFMPAMMSSIYGEAIQYTLEHIYYGAHYVPALKAGQLHEIYNCKYSITNE
jgi:hypothetical protein